MSSPGNITFQKFGKSRHLLIESWEDTENVLQVNEALWVATGAPIPSLNCDPTFLDLVDTDGNSRIMCFEIENAIGWLLRCLKDRSGITDLHNRIPKAPPEHCQR